MGVLSTRMKSIYGIEISEEQENLLINYLRSILEVNKTINLTRIISEDEGLISHLEDSLTGLPYLQNAPQGLYGDLGTGGGFPGVPLGIVSGRETILVDSVKKKAKVLNDTIKGLGFDTSFKIYAGRIEDLALEQKEMFSVLTARALSSLASLLELASPLLCIGGRLICYKARPSEDELAQASRIERFLGMKNIVSHSFLLSDNSQRCILVYEKISQPRVKLPRRVGMAQKNPFDYPL